jgi:hypothetical protein
MRTSNDAHHLGKEFKGCTAAFESVSKREYFGKVGQTKRWLSGVAEKVPYGVPSRRCCKHSWAVEGSCGADCPGKGKLVNVWQVIDPKVDLLRNSSD